MNSNSSHQIIPQRNDPNQAFTLNYILSAFQQFICFESAPPQDILRESSPIKLMHKLTLTENSPLLWNPNLRAIHFPLGSPHFHRHTPKKRHDYNHVLCYFITCGEWGWIYNTVLLRSEARTAKWIIQKRWSQTSDGLWLNCMAFVCHSEFGPGAEPIPFSSWLCMNKLAHFNKKVLWKGERGQVVGQHFFSTHALIHAGISISLAHLLTMTSIDHNSQSERWEGHVVIIEEWTRKDNMGGREQVVTERKNEV